MGGGHKQARVSDEVDDGRGGSRLEQFFAAAGVPQEGRVQVGGSLYVEGVPEGDELFECNHVVVEVVAREGAPFVSCRVLGGEKTIPVPKEHVRRGRPPA